MDQSRHLSRPGELESRLKREQLQLGAIAQGEFRELDAARGVRLLGKVAEDDLNGLRGSLFSRPAHDVPFVVRHRRVLVDHDHRIRVIRCEEGSRRRPRTRARVAAARSSDSSRRAVRD